MTDQSLLKVGLIGTIVTELCCFTPILVTVLSVLGLTAVVGYVDIVLLPLLAVFALVLMYAVIRRLQHG